MPYQKDWKISDILELTAIRGLHIHDIRYIIENYPNKESVDISTLPAKISLKITGDTLFGHRKNGNNGNIYEILEKCQQKGIKPLSYWDDEYPPYLRQIESPPLVIYSKGSIRLNNKEPLAIVGTRKYTQYGKLTAERFAEVFIKNGIPVVSGLAQGIDTAAHLACVRNNGITYAVIASGIDKISPYSSHKNAESIVDSGGAIISEYPPGTSAKPGYFPLRNRIISGISKAVVVIESGGKGGALITARFAFDQSREVFAVPGNINSEKSIGTNELIKKNIAAIAVSPESVLADLGLIELNANLFSISQDINFQDEVEKKVFDILSHEPKQIDELAFEADLDISVLHVKLLNLEFKELIKQLPGKYYVKSF